MVIVPWFPLSYNGNLLVLGARSLCRFNLGEGAVAFMWAWSVKKCALSIRNTRQR